MNNNDVKYMIRIILNFLIIGLIIFLVIKLFAFLLPIILVLVAIYIIYLFILKSKNNTVKKQKEIKNKIPEAEIVKEKFDKQ